MADSTPFALVDVFTEQPLEGNPLALVPDADALPEGLLPRIAREFHQAETTFLLRPAQPGVTWRLRSFTAAGIEVFGPATTPSVPGGGWRPRAGSAPTAARGVGASSSGSTVLPVEITVDGNRRIEVTLEQQAAEYGAELTDRAALAEALGVDGDGLGAAAGLPVAQVVSTGAAHLMVGLREPSRRRGRASGCRPAAGVAARCRRPGCVPVRPRSGRARRRGACPLRQPGRRYHRGPGHRERRGPARLPPAPSRPGR